MRQMPQPSRRKASVFAAFAILPSISAIAEGSDEQTIEDTVIVGRATNVVVTSEELKLYQANDLADVFRLTPSISVGGSLGIAQKIYIRGLEDNYVNVTVDGAPQTSTLFHHIGRVNIDPSLLKEVEVQAGAGEATSGAGAIGGAVRFKTKEANDLLDQDKRFGGQLKAGLFSNDGEQYSLSLLGRINDDWGVLAYYNQIDRENFDDGDGNEVLGTASEQSLGFIKLSGVIGDNQKLSLSYEDRDEEADFSARPNWHVQPGDLLYASDATRETIVANYLLNQNDALNLELSLYDTESSFHGGRFDYTAVISTYGFDIRNTTLLGNHKLTYGIDYRDDMVEAGVPLYAKEEGSVLGIYAQAHSELTEQLVLSYGARYDDYDFEQRVLTGNTGQPNEFNDSDLSYNLGLIYTPIKNWALGLGYAEAFRGKEIGDGFTVDQPEFGSPFAEDLKGESVSNIETSVEYNGDHLGFKLAVFESHIDDAISDRLSGGGAVYENAGTVETNGFEVELFYQFNNLNLTAGYSNIDAKLKPKAGYYDQNYDSVELAAYEFRHLGTSRGNTWNLSLDYTPSSSITTGINLSYIEDLEINTLYEGLQAGWVSSLYRLKKDAYTTVDLYAEWKALEALTLNLSIINAFDEQYRDHSSVGDYNGAPGYGIVVGPWEAGRDIRFTVSYNF